MAETKKAVFLAQVGTLRKTASNNCLHDSPLSTFWQHLPRPTTFFGTVAFYDSTLISLAVLFCLEVVR